MSANSVQQVKAAIVSGHGRALLPFRLGLLLAVAVIAAVVGAGSTSALRYALAISVAYAFAVLANGVVLGGLGEINLSTGGFLAVGAYVGGYLLTKDVSAPLAMVTAMVVTAAVGFVLAIPTVRLQGIFTALATFVLAYAIPQTLVYLDRFTGGNFGLSLPLVVDFFGISIGGSSTGQLYLSLVLFVLAGALTYALSVSRWGKRVLWVGEAEVAGAVFGVRIRWVKVAVWTYGAALCGLGGTLFALTAGFLSPDQFGAMLGISLFVGAVVLGARSVWGALLGGMFVGVLPHELQNIVPTSATGVVFGLVLFAAILVGTGGLVKPVETLCAGLWGRMRGQKGD